MTAAAMHEVPAHWVIAGDAHWLLNHRIDSALPGYLMLSSRHPGSLGQLPTEALGSLGDWLARAERAMQARLAPARIYVGRYGHDAGWALHFHLIPVYRWMEQTFWRDTRYRSLQAFGTPPPTPQTDGAELTLFIWREFCERPDPPPVSGPSVTTVIGWLRQDLG